jgi:hypothetical protein
MERGVSTDSTSFAGSGKVSSASTGYPVALHKGFGGIVSSNHPTFDKILTTRAKVIGMEFSVASTRGRAAASGAGDVTYVSSPLSNSTDILFQQMIDAVILKIANAQTAVLTNGADFGTYLNTYLSTWASLYSMASMLNADGFNEVTEKVAAAGTQLRSRVQSAYERLQSLPICPGFVDIVPWWFGLTAPYEGGPAWLVTMNTAGSGAALDYSNSANWTTILNQIETALTTLITASESGIVKFIMAEYFGTPPELPVHGVKIHPGLYDGLKLVAFPFAGATKTFVLPALTTDGTAVVKSGTVPLFIPVELRDYPIWSTFNRLMPFGGCSNVNNADASFTGMFEISNGGAWTLRKYPTGGGAPSTVSLTASASDGYGTGAENIFYSPAINSETDFANDGRPHGDYIVYQMSTDQIIDETVKMDQRLWIAKERLPLPAGTKMWSTNKVHNRGLRQTLM